MSDEEMMPAGNGTVMPFEAIFDSFAADVYRYVHRRTLQDDAEDIVAEVFLLAWRKLADIPDGFERPWLYRSAWNLLANSRRKRTELPFAELPREPHMDDIADVVVDDHGLRRAWQSLSERDQELIRLASWDGLDSKALAAVLSLSVGGATAALSRARERLAVALAHENSADERRKPTSDNINKVTRR